MHNPPDDLLRILNEIMGMEDEEVKKQLDAVQAQVESAKMLRRQLLETYDEGLSTQLKILSRVQTMTVGGLSGFAWTQTRLLIDELTAHLEEVMRTVITKLDAKLREEGFRIDLYPEEEGNEAE